MIKAVPLTCTGHSRPVTHLSFSGFLHTRTLADVETAPFYTLISACKDGNPMLRDGVTGDWIGTFLGHKGAIWCSNITKDGKWVVTASADFTAAVWDADTGEQVCSLPHDHIVRGCDFPAGSSRDSRVELNGEDGGETQGDDLLIVTGGQDHLIRICNVPKRCTQMVWDAGDSIRSVLWPSKSLIVTVGFGGDIKWWDLSLSLPGSGSQPGSKPKCTITKNVGIILAQVQHENGLIVTAAGTNVYVIEVATGDIVRKFELDYPVSAVSVSKDQDRFMTGSATDTYVRLHDFRDGELLDVFKGHHGPVHVIAYSPDGCVAATGSEDGTIRLLKTTTEPYGLWKQR